MSTKSGQLGRKLLKADLEWLSTSWITPELAAHAQLRRFDDTTAAELLYAKRGGDCAGIGFPYLMPWEPEIVKAWRIRRDRPEVEFKADGSKKETTKYLGATGDRNHLYFAPGTPLEHLALEVLPIVITEGEKKTLALQRLATECTAAHDELPPFLPIGLSGVWNWRTTTGKALRPDGTRTDERGPLPEFDRLNLEGRHVYICFDADLVTNPKVAQARWSLARFLQSRRARVSYLEIPAEAEVKAIDDLLVAWGGERVMKLFANAPAADPLVDIRMIAREAKATGDVRAVIDNVKLIAQLNETQLLEAYTLLRRELSGSLNISDLKIAVQAERIERGKRAAEDEEKQRPKFNGRRYVVNEHGIWYFKTGRDGHYESSRLANFAAEIVSDVVMDDGQEESRRLRLKTQFAGREQYIDLSTNEFRKAEWALDKLGPLAIIYTGGGERLVAEAIPTLSASVEMRRIYQHTGWAKIGGRPTFVHAGGGIDASGAVVIEVELNPHARHFLLPDPLEGIDLREAVDTSLRFLDIAPDDVVWPLYCAIWRAPLGQVTLSLFVAGQTQSGKTQLAALVQQHYGAEMFDGQLPANWTSTANALEAQLNELKDVVSIVDDFNPTGNAGDIQKWHSIAERVFRAQGNKSGRARMTADGAVRRPKPPRGLPVATGEDIPRGHSLRARLVIVELAPGDVRFKLLTERQQAARSGIYAKVMASYLKWLAARYDKIPAQIAEELEQLRNKPALRGASRRAPDNIAQLAIGARMFLRFCMDTGALSRTRADELWQHCFAALLKTLAAQDEHQTGAEPCEQFLAYIASALSSGRAHFADCEGCEPKQAQRWGWRIDPSSSHATKHPMGECIGWIDGDDIYLEPTTAFAVAQRLARDSGENIPVGLKTLQKRLKDRGFLAECDDGRNTVKRPICGGRPRVLFLTRDKLSTLFGSGQSGQSAQLFETEEVTAGQPGQSGQFEDSVSF